MTNDLTQQSTTFTEPTTAPLELTTTTTETLTGELIVGGDEPTLAQMIPATVRVIIYVAYAMWQAALAVIVAHTTLDYRIEAALAAIGTFVALLAAANVQRRR
jgi:hypothetical protein